MVREGSGHFWVKDTNKQVLDLFSPGHTGCTRTTNDEQEYRKHEEHTVDSQMYIKLGVINKYPPITASQSTLTYHIKLLRSHVLHKSVTFSNSMLELAQEDLPKVYE